MSEHAASPRAAIERTLRPVLREKQDIGIRFMLSLLGFIGFCLLLTLGIAYMLFPREIHDRRFGLPFPQYPQPALQPSPPADMQAFYMREMQRLNSAGWIDRKAGIVHIPIAQAMRDVAAEGIPGWPAGNAAASEGDRR